MTSVVATEFARKIRDREPAIGYWVVLDSPVSTDALHVWATTTSHWMRSTG